MSLSGPDTSTHSLSPSTAGTKPNNRERSPPKKKKSNLFLFSPNYNIFRAARDWRRELGWYGWRMSEGSKDGQLWNKRRICCRRCSCPRFSFLFFIFIFLIWRFSTHISHDFFFFFHSLLFLIWARIHFVRIAFWQVGLLKGGILMVILLDFSEIWWDGLLFLYISFLIL